MSPFFLSVASLLVRAALLLLSGWLEAHGRSSFTEDQITKATPAIAAIAWSIWSAYRSRQKMLVAARSPSPISERQIEHVIAAGDAPSVHTLKGEVPF